MLPCRNHCQPLLHPDQNSQQSIRDLCRNFYQRVVYTLKNSIKRSLLSILMKGFSSGPDDYAEVLLNFLEFFKNNSCNSLSTLRLEMSVVVYSVRIGCKTSCREVHKIVFCNIFTTLLSKMSG